MAVHSCVIWTIPHAGRAVWRVLFQHSPFAAVQLSARLMLGTLRPSEPCSCLGSHARDRDQRARDVPPYQVDHLQG